jgi:molecular chaperone DnaJ
LAKRDYYEVLGVERSCTAEELKKAYRQSALKYHPDRNPDDPGSEERFKECTEAYQVLCDGERRARYDRFGHNMPNGFGAPDMGYVNIEDVLGDLFGDFFGGRGRQRSRRGADLRYDLKIGFMEAFTGIDKTISVPKNVTCPACKGSRSKPGTSPTVCPACNGQGQVRFQQSFFSIARTCHRCGGAGRVIVSPCDRCRGTGLIEEEKKLLVKIPPGVDTGQKIRYRGEGETSEAGGATGDLYVVIVVDDHPLFMRHGSDLLVELPLSFPQAALGDEVKVPTPDGLEKMKVPPGTQAGKVFRLRAKGMPDPNGRGRGDLHVRVFVEVPTKLSDEQQDLLNRFAQISGEDINPQSKSFFAKVREIFGAKA